MPPADDLTRCLAPKAAECLLGIFAEINSIFNSTIKPSLLQIILPSSHERIIDAKLRFIEQFGGLPPSLQFEVRIEIEGERVLSSIYGLASDIPNSNLILIHSDKRYEFKTTRGVAAFMSELIFKDLRENKFAANAA
jgi:hypothetical protein